MGKPDNVNTTLTDALYKAKKAAFCHRNKVDFYSQMYIWDVWQHSVKIKEMITVSITG